MTVKPFDTIERIEFIVRPCRKVDSPALWDWLESEHPDLMTQFAIAFGLEVRDHCQGVPSGRSEHPELRDHIKQFLDQD